MSSVRTPIALAALLATAACVSTPPVPQPSPAAPHFDPIAFFTGKLRGTGTLHKIFSGAEHTLVDSSGHVDGDTLVLTQVVHEGDKPARTRSWRIHRDAPDRYSGTLTDAKGPVTMDVTGNRLHIAFTMKGNLPTEQWLTLGADGQSAQNVMVVRKFGIPVARLDEDIRKIN